MHAVPFAKILVPTATAHATGHGTCFKLLLCNILHVIYIKIDLQSAFELSNWLSCGIKNKLRGAISVGRNTVREIYIIWR